MKRFTKIFAMVLVVVMVVGMFSTMAFAAPVNSFTGAANLNATDNTMSEKIGGIGGTAISIIKTVGFIMAVVMVFIYAIKWMMATPQKKQELKERLWYLAIGVILLIGGPQILEWISSAASSMTQGS